MAKTDTKKETKTRVTTTPTQATKILMEKRDAAKRPIPKGTTYTVVKFAGQSKPCTVKCSRHGEWDNTFGNLIGRHSSLCPTCSKEIRSAAAAVRKAERDKVIAEERAAKEVVRAEAKAAKDAEKAAAKAKADADRAEVKAAKEAAKAKAAADKKAAKVAADAKAAKEAAAAKK